MRFKVLYVVFSVGLLFCCESERVYFPKQTRKAFFTFDKLRSSKQVLNQEDILKQLKSKRKSDNPKNFKVKSIKLDSDTQKKIKIKGKGVDLEMNAQSGLDFKAEIVLEQEGYEEVQLLNCEFELNAEKFIFSKFQKTFSIGGIINAPEILASIRGATEKGYSIKAIALSGNSAKVTGKKPNFKIEMVKSKSFSATIILEKENHFEVKIVATFKILKGKAPKLAFSKFKTLFDPAGIAGNRITQNIKGDIKGYQLKNIVFPKEFGNITGKKPYLFLNLKKAGNFKAKIILEKENYQDAEIPDCEFEIVKLNAPVLTFAIAPFTPFERLFKDGKISNLEIMQKIGGHKKGYKLKNVVLSPYYGFTTKNKNLQLHLKRAGVFKGTIILEKPGYEDAKIQNSTFTILKNPAPTLGFKGITKLHGTNITHMDILNAIQGPGQGYQLREIVPTPFAKITKNYPEVIMEMIKVGNFTSQITLEKLGYHDAIIRNCNFQIDGKPKANLSFLPLTRPFGNGIITALEILSQIPEPEKAGYRLKNIVLTNPQFGNKEGTKPNFQIKLLKAGNFTATLTLEKNGFQDATITAQFNISKNIAPNLTFQPYTHAFGDGKSISETKILENIQGLGKLGYQVKEIVFLPEFGTFNPTHSKINLLKTGNFKAAIRLEKPGYQDKIIQNCPFTIQAKKFTFQKYTVSVNHLAPIAPEKIKDQIKEDLQGYTLKAITGIPSVFGRIQQFGPIIFIIPETINKLGGPFKVDITFQHANYFDVELTGCEFEFTKNPPETIIWNPGGYSRTLNNGKTITARQILDNLVGSNIFSKIGYSIKEIKDISDDSLVELSGTAPNVELVLKKGGNFDATIVLRHDTKEDVEIRDADFDIEDPQIVSRKFTRYSEQGDSVSFEEMLEYSFKSNNPKWRLKKGLSGTGYTVKSISIPSSAQSKIEKSLTGLKFKKLGTSTVRITLENPDYFDVTLDAEFAMIFDYAFGGDGFDQSNDLIQTKDGDYLIVGTTENQTAGKGLQGFMVKMSPIGKTKWQKAIGGADDEVYNAIVGLDDDFAVAGYKITAGGSDKDFLIMKFDKDGTKKWEQNYGASGTQEEARSIIALSGGDLVVVGYKAASGKGAWVMRLKGSDGSQIWEKTYGGNADDRFHDIRELSGGGLMLGGRKKQSAKTVNKKGGGTHWAAYTDGYVIIINPTNGNVTRDVRMQGANVSSGDPPGSCRKYDGDDEIYGIIESEKLLKSYARSAGPAGKGPNWFVVGRTSAGCQGGENIGGQWIAKHEKDRPSAVYADFKNRGGGWKKDGGVATDLLELKNSSVNPQFIVVGRNKETGNDIKATILKMEIEMDADPTGSYVFQDLEKKKEVLLGGTGKSYINAVIQDKKGDLVVVGYTQTRGTGQSYNFWISKIDSDTLKIIGSF